MKRKRSIPKGRPKTLAATPSAQPSHKESPLLLLPQELRDLVLRNLLYSAEPLGAKGNVDHNLFHKRQSERNFTFYPAILRVCRQVYDEGYEILYHHNIATASIIVWHDDSSLVVKILDDLWPIAVSDVAIAGRFTRWDVTLKLNLEFPEDVSDSIYWFLIDNLRPIPNLDVLKVRLKLWDMEDIYKPESNVTFDNHQDFDDIAEQVFRPFSILRVRQVEFVDTQGRPIRTTLSLARLMMSDSPPPISLHDLFIILDEFLENSLTEQSYRVVKARLPALEIARDYYDVDAFCIALRSMLAYLTHFRGLVPPKHLVEFAQGFAPGATDMRRITDCANET